MGFAALLCLVLVVFMMLSGRHVVAAVAVGVLVVDLLVLLVVGRSPEAATETEGKGTKGSGWIWMGAIELAFIAGGAVVWAATGDWYWICYGLVGLAASFCLGVSRVRKRSGRIGSHEFLRGMWS
jgi:hypothetical protein